MVRLNSRSRWDLNSDKAMAETVRQARIPLCITDPNLSDNPIVFANAAFYDLTGYTESEVIGKNCRLLQGEKTTARSVKCVRDAIDARKVETVEIVNYRKDGAAFINALQVGPIFDDEGHLMYYFGSQLDVTRKRDAERKVRELADDELLHRLRNIVNVMDVVIRRTSREVQDSRAFADIVSGRLRALSEAHFQTIRIPEVKNHKLRDLAETILSAYAANGDEQFRLSGPEVGLPTSLQSCVALCLHELATNSVKHGALGAASGKVNIGWSFYSADEDKKLIVQWQDFGGPKVEVPERSSGSAIVRDLIALAGGSIEFDWKESGVVVEIMLHL